MQTSYTQTAEDRGSEDDAKEDPKEDNKSKDPKSGNEPLDKEEVVDKKASKDNKNLDEEK